MIPISKSTHNHKYSIANISLCACALGMSLFLGYRVVRWINNTLQAIRQINQLAQTQLTTQKPLSSHSSLPGDKTSVKKTEALDPAAYTLDSRIVAQVQPYLDNPKLCASLPRAPNGITPVYIPKDVSVVLKYCDNGRAKFRFSQTMKAAALCHQNGYKRMVVPKAHVHNNFIIEDKLPVRHAEKANVGLYVENREKFTLTAREFTSFLCQSNHDDLLVYDKLFPSEVPRCRHDNVCFFLGTNNKTEIRENLDQVGLVGFLDLEEFSLISGKQGSDFYLSACKTALCFFPYHLEDILNVIKEFDHMILNHQSELQKYQQKVLEYFNKLYLDHADFLKEKQIAPTEPLKMIEIDDLRKKEIQLEVEAYLKQQYQKNWDDDESIDPDILVGINCVKIALPNIINCIMQFLSTRLHEKMHAGEGPLQSFDDLVVFRSLGFKFSELHVEVCSMLQNMPEAAVKHRNQLVVDTIITIFKELQKGREIAFCNPQIEYTPPKEKKWMGILVFC